MRVRTTVRIEDSLMQRIRRLAPHRGFSRFVNDVLAAHVGRLDREQLEREMIDGYTASREDRRELSRDWEVVNAEGWPS